MGNTIPIVNSKYPIIDDMDTSRPLLFKGSTLSHINAPSIIKTSIRGEVNRPKNHSLLLVSSSMMVESSLNVSYISNLLKR